MAVIGFAIAIGGIFIGDPAGAAGVAGNIKASEEAIKEIKNVKNTWEGFKQLLQSDTMKNPKDCGKALADLVPTVHKSVSSVINLEMNPSMKLPTTDKVSGADGGSAAIQSIAAWTNGTSSQTTRCSILSTRRSRAPLHTVWDSDNTL